jgi:exonuclease SbcC
MEQFCTLQKLTSEAHFIRKPKLIKIQTKSGEIQVAGLPGFDKGYFRSQYPGLSAEEENKIFSQGLANILTGLSAQLNPTIPSVLMAHHTVVGCEMDNGTHIFQANEVVLDAAAIDNSNFDLVCLGHIHKAQKLDICNKPALYSGSIDAFTFNDEGNEKGFWIHKLFNPDGSKHKANFVETPAREFMTYCFDQGSIKGINQHGPYYMGSTLELQNKVVRILYSCDQDTERVLDKKKLERDLYAAGAYYVREIRPEKIEASVNRERMHENPAGLPGKTAGGNTHHRDTETQRKERE